MGRLVGRGVVVFGFEVGICVLLKNLFENGWVVWDILVLVVDDVFDGDCDCVW